MKTQHKPKQGKQRYGDLNEQIYKFNRRTNTILTGLEDSKNYDVVKLFEMFLEHFDNETSDEQILNHTVFLDFLNKTDSATIDNQNFTEP